MHYTLLDSPIGQLTVSTDGQSITGLHIEGDRFFTAIPEGWTEDASQPLLIQAGRELTEYFTGKRKTFSLLIKTNGTDFQQQVWDVLRHIPYGETTTYGEIAKKIGKPKAVRAVGNAVGRNSICIFIPCHRVIAGDGTLGGFVAGLHRKEKLLQTERAR